MDLDRIKHLVKKAGDDKIEILRIYKHTKASEVYASVTFHYEGRKKWEGAVPIEYPRGGIYSETPEDAVQVIQKSYIYQDPKREFEWKKIANEFWKKSSSKVTLPIFKALLDSKWKCVSHLAQTNNPQRRIQDIKDKGFILATDTNRFCKRCKKNTTHHILLRFQSGVLRKYEGWSSTLRKKIIKVLGNRDVYEDRKAGADILPDHKFPEARWDAKTSQKNPDNMSEKQIKRKFQLLNNRRNEQKREACRTCYQTGKRGIIYGIKFYYEGNENWGKGIPKRGKGAEQGCVGCGWYDIEKWREELNKTLGN